MPKTTVVNSKFHPKNIPAKFLSKEPGFKVVPMADGFWSFRCGLRSPGTRDDLKPSRMLKWILWQTAFGHSAAEFDEAGEIVSMTFGRQVPDKKAESPDAAAAEIIEKWFALEILGRLAKGREKGCLPREVRIYADLWEHGGASLIQKLELNYGLEMCELLGRISKKLPDLEFLPILENAPERTRSYLAEATRCYLFKLERSCVALCRACLEGTLESKISNEMKAEWREAQGRNQKQGGDSNRFKALIDVCGKHGILGDYVQDAHDVRKQANDVLHINPETRCRQIPHAVFWRRPDGSSISYTATLQHEWNRVLGATSVGLKYQRRFRSILD